MQEKVVQINGKEENTILIVLELAIDRGLVEVVKFLVKRKNVNTYTGVDYVLNNVEKELRKVEFAIWQLKSAG